jgi:hypothetical protein
MGTRIRAGILVFERGKSSKDNEPCWTWTLSSEEIIPSPLFECQIQRTVNSKNSSIGICANIMREPSSTQIDAFLFF